MAFASEFELEDELELELLDLKEAPEMENLDGPSLWESKALPGGFMARISGFDWTVATPPPARHDPGRPVLQIHRSGVKQIVDAIKARTTFGNCVTLTVAGFTDPGGESAAVLAQPPFNTNPKDLSQKRADSIFNQIMADPRLSDAEKGRIKQTKSDGLGNFSPIHPSNTHRQRALNRRVEVLVLKLPSCI